MGLKDWWQQYQTTRAKKYLQSHSHLAIDVLRRDPLVAAQAMEQFFTLDAAKGGAPDRQTYPYPTLTSMGFGGRSPLLQSVPKSVNFQIRTFSNYPPARRAINALTNPILDLPFTIGVKRPIGTQAHDEQAPPTGEQQARIKAATAMLERPNDGQTWREWLEMIVEDLVVMGGGVFEVAENTSDERPLFLWPVDCQSIRINANWQPGLKVYRYSQGRGYLFGAVGTTDEIKLDDDELCYMKLNPRTDTPFGTGYMEVAFSTVNAFMGAFQFAERRASNATPLFGLFLGENVTIDQVRQWQHYWENEIEGYGKTPILGGGRQPSVFNMTGAGDDPLYLKWQEWCVRIIAMSCGLSPMRLGLERDVNRSTAQQGANDDWSTVAPVANLLKDGFTHWLLWKKLGWSDLAFEWQIKSNDELRQSEILAEQYQMNAITVDEIRKIYERPPLKDGLGDMVRSQFESAIKAALAPTMPGPGGDDSSKITMPGPPKIPMQSAAFLSPFGDCDDEMLSPRERAFIRGLLQEKRREGFRFEAVAG